MNNSEVPPGAAMLQMLFGFSLSQTIRVAAELGLADEVKAGPRTVAELAAATGAHAPSLARLLRALAGVGIFAEDGEGRFGSTPLAATLESGAPGSLRMLARVALGQEHYIAWGELLHSVRTGETAFDHAFGQDVWQYYAAHPEHARNFNQFMTEMTAGANAALLAAYDFSGARKLVDVGGGEGEFLTATLKANPGLRGVVFDQPRVVAGAPSRFAAAGLTERAEAVGGDFFAGVSAGGDVYLLKWIIHDWDDERAVKILSHCRRAMIDDGRLLVVEMVLQPGDQAPLANLADINMMVMTGGRERSEEDYRALLAAAGFRLTRVIPTESFYSIVEGVRA